MEMHLLGISRYIAYCTMHACSIRGGEGIGREGSRKGVTWAMGGGGGRVNTNVKVHSSFNSVFSTQSSLLYSVFIS